MINEEIKEELIKRYNLYMKILCLYWLLIWKKWKIQNIKVLMLKLLFI